MVIRAFVLWVVFCTSCLLGVVQAADITVLPDRNPVVAGEVFTLTFSSDAQPDGNPDFSPLDKDFEVISTSSSSNVQIVNGFVSKEIVWRLQVFPRSTGIVQIPAIQFGNDASKPLNIVVAKSTENDGKPDGVIVELESSVENPYVQQQIIITQRLLHSVALRKSGATMSHPAITAGTAMVEQLGGINNKTVLREGIKYKVSERRYAIFPQTSGTLTLGRTVFQGILDDGRKRRDPFGMSGRQIRRFSDPLELEIKEQPPDSGPTWLPANSLSINAHWQVPVEQFKTGEPVTLTLAIIADGLLAEQLPELYVQLPKGIKGYSNQPEFTNNSNGGSVIGTRQEKWILIGTAPGEYDVPPVSLQWWDLKANKLTSAATEPVTIKVTGAVNNSQAINDPAAVSGQVPENPPTGGDAEEGGDANEKTAADDELITEKTAADMPDADRSSAASQSPFSPLWLWLAGLTALGLVGVGIWLRRRLKKGVSGRTAKKFQARNKVNSLELLQKACTNNEPQKAYDALSDWVKQDLQLTPATLSQLRKEADFPLKQALDDLSMSLYSSQHDAWEGSDLWLAVNQHLKPTAVKSNHSGLVSLYPD